MPEEGFETAELKESLETANEHAHGHGGHGGEHGAEKRETWIVQLSLSTALIAVLAAIAALQSGSFANQALADKNDSILAQSKASDLWTYYQAKGIKSIIFETQAEALPDTKADAITRFRAAAKKQTEDQKELDAKAKEQEKIVKEKDESSELLFHKHHQFALAVTVFQVTIAMAAIAALTKRRVIWLVSLAVSLAGIYFFVQGYLAGHALGSKEAARRCLVERMRRCPLVTSLRDGSTASRCVCIGPSRWGCCSRAEVAPHREFGWDIC